eukprot:g16472.t1
MDFSTCFAVESCFNGPLTFVSKYASQSYWPMWNVFEITAYGPSWKLALIGEALTMEQEQDLTRSSKRQKQRHESDQTATVVPATTVLAGLSPDLWRLVCSFVADNPLWLFRTWARVCKRASSPSARPPAPPFALDMCKIRGPVPTTVWQEWKELTRLTFQDMQPRQPVFAALAANRTRVHTIGIDNIRDSDLAGAAGIYGLRSIEKKIKENGWEFDEERKPRKIHGSVTDAWLVHLAGLHSLRCLDLSYCDGLTDAGLTRKDIVAFSCHTPELEYYDFIIKSCFRIHLGVVTPCSTPTDSIGGGDGIEVDGAGVTLPNSP